MSTLLIHDAGPLTTIQDLGRPGYLRVGIPASGPMDREAFVLGNRLVGNTDAAAGLECTLIGPRVEFTDDRMVAVTGADMAVTLNGGEAPRWQAFRVKAGDVLKLGAAKTGVRAGETPVFWACGVTPQAVALASKPAFMITHSPGHMFITDLPNHALAAI